MKTPINAVPGASQHSAGAVSIAIMSAFGVTLLVGIAAAFGLALLMGSALDVVAVSARAADPAEPAVCLSAAKSAREGIADRNESP